MKAGFESSPLDTKSLSGAKIKLHENNLWNEAFLKVVNTTSVLGDSTNKQANGAGSLNSKNCFMNKEPVIQSTDMLNLTNTDTQSEFTNQTSVKSNAQEVTAEITPSGALSKEIDFSSLGNTKKNARSHCKKADNMPSQLTFSSEKRLENIELFENTKGETSHQATSVKAKGKQYLTRTDLQLMLKNLQK